ncbi:MAG: autotransporter outer membrane beta-barrel domain-containing protein [Gammaproteobacteria bacterium]|jgi:hypothetical protein|nr:autotransporter outer membrane beta-barrel domain-containing protein [Gammaproteobacteria bacterium]
MLSMQRRAAWRPLTRVIRARAPGRHTSPYVWLIGCLACLAATSAHADEWWAAPRVSLVGLYDSNPRLVTSGHDGAFGARLNLAADLGWATETTSVTFTPRLRSDRYTNEQDLLNSDDQYFDLTASTETERAKVGVDGKLSYTTVVSNEDVVEDIGPAQQRIREQVSRDSRTLRPHGSYRLTERDTLQADANLTDVNYGGQGYVDYTFYVSNLSWAHALSPRDTVSLLGYASRFERDLPRQFLGVAAVNDPKGTTDNVGLQVGYQRALTETLTGNVAAGAVRSEFKPDPLRFAGGGRLDLFEDATNYGTLINVGLSQRLEQTEWEVSASRSLQPTGDGVLVRRDELKVDVSQDFGPLTTGRLAVLAFHDQRDQEQARAGNRADRRYARVETGLSYRLARHWTLSGEYRYRYQKYQEAEDSAESNGLWVTLSYAGDRWSVSR